MDKSTNHRLNNIETKLDCIIELLNKLNKDSISLPNLQNDKNQTKIVKNGNAIVNLYNDFIIITGNTYENKENIKQIGGKWNKENKGWKLPIDKIDEVKDMVKKYFTKTNLINKNRNLVKTNQKYESDESDNVSQDYGNNDCDIDSD